MYKTFPKSIVSFCVPGILLLVLFVFDTDSVLAVGDASFPQNTTVNLTLSGSSVDFTIEADSDADEVTVNTDNIVVKITGGQRFNLISNDRYTINDDSSSYVYGCASGSSNILLNPASGVAQATITITPTTVTCGASGSGSGGNGGGGGGGGGSGLVSTSTPTPTPQTTPVLTPSPSTASATPVTSRTVPSDFGLKSGDVVGAAGANDPDIFIVNDFGFKRLFLNPVIFNFYGHLGGFTKVKSINVAVRDKFVTSGLFRNCETNDPKVYGVEVSGEDTGTLHWVNTTGAQAVQDDPDFFKKVFCINNNEFGWYKKGASYTSVKQIPAYSRKTAAVAAPVTAASGKLKVDSTIPWLNVRDQASLKGKILGQVLPSQQFNFVDFKNGWYKIRKDGKDFGWVFGEYIIKL